MNFSSRLTEPKQTTIDEALTDNSVDASNEQAANNTAKLSASAEPVCILGMHRSGTSMVTSLLRDCQLYLGPDEDLAKKALDNVEGFWENKNFVRLNEDILECFGGRWDEPPVFPVHWELNESIDPLFQRASELVQGFKGHEPWGWKDPRNSLTIPFWRKLIPSLNFVVCIRNPLEVAHSLFVRGDSKAASQFQLWQHYYQQILAATTESSRIVTHYQSYFENARAEVNRVANWIGLECSDETVERVYAHVSRTLRHHHATTNELKTAGASDEVIDLYRRLCDEAGPSCRQFLERESRSAVPAHQVSDNTSALQLMRVENKLAKYEERLCLVEQYNSNLEAQLHRVSTALREAQVNNEKKVHEVRASLLPVMRMLDKLRAVRNRLRSLMKGT